MNADRIRRKAGSMKSTRLVGSTVPDSKSDIQAPQMSITSSLEGLDTDMQAILKDWNAPAVGVGIVVNETLVLAKGYGCRDYEKKLPFTTGTLFPVASNTKLFTAIAAGLLVEEGRLTWDKPVREKVPSIRFYNDSLNNTITLRDMLSHRTGITRHDSIWYKSEFTRKELFERVAYLEPKEPPRQIFLYNNMMYAAVGYIIELITGKTWEEFVRERILQPLGMSSSLYTISDMVTKPEFSVPFTEKRDTTEIYRIPYYDDTMGVAPAGAIISNLDDMSHWLIALMNDGKYNGNLVFPPNVLKATMEPAISLPNAMGETRGFWELLNSTYGMGRWTASYRGHLLTYHGGDIDGFHSQVSILPQERIGVVVLVIGDHCGSLYNTISYNIYERLLGLNQTPWSERWLDVIQKGKQAGMNARASAGAERVSDTQPSHTLADYAGDFEHPAYGILKIELTGGQLSFNFHKFQFPLTHFHYDRFDTFDDERYGKWSVNFVTNPQGDIDKAVISLDEAEVVFQRKPPTLGPERLRQLAGTYETPNGFAFQVVLRDEDGSLYLVSSGQPDEKLVPYKELKFRVPAYSDRMFEFVDENGRIKALKHRDPSGEYVFPRR